VLAPPRGPLGGGCQLVGMVRHVEDPAECVCVSLEKGGRE
jgi:hypothetical protein